MDLGYYRHIECCIVNATIETLSEHGLPIPDRTEPVYSGVLGDPNCCDAILVKRTGTTVPREWLEKGCVGPVKRTLKYELRVFRDLCPADPIAEKCDRHTHGGCDLVFPCPGEPWPDPPDDPCQRQDRTWQENLIAADQIVVETTIAGKIMACLCAARCDEPCPWKCETVRWTGTRPVTGACGGTIFLLEVDTIG